jgi:hypothetical protein
MKRHLKIAEKYLALGTSLAVADFYVQLDAAQFWLNRMSDAAKALIERIELAHESPAAGSN